MKDNFKIPPFAPCLLDNSTVRELRDGTVDDRSIMVRLKQKFPLIRIEEVSDVRRVVVGRVFAGGWCQIKSAVQIRPLHRDLPAIVVRKTSDGSMDHCLARAVCVAQEFVDRFLWGCNGLNRTATSPQTKRNEVQFVEDAFFESNPESIEFAKKPVFCGSYMQIAKSPFFGSFFRLRSRTGFSAVVMEDLNVGVRGYLFLDHQSGVRTTRRNATEQMAAKELDRAVRKAGLIYLPWERWI